MCIRIATEKDAAMLANLVKSLAHFYLNDSSQELPAWLSATLTSPEFLARISNPEYLNLVFEEAGTVTGYLSLKGDSHIYHLFVSAASQTKGIARRLWQRAKSHSSAKIFSVRSSIYAVPVYRKLGFIETGPASTKDGVSFQPMEHHL